MIMTSAPTDRESGLPPPEAPTASDEHPEVAKHPGYGVGELASLLGVDEMVLARWIQDEPLLQRAVGGSEDPQASGEDPQAGGEDPQAGGEDPQAGGEDPLRLSFAAVLEFVTSHAAVLRDEDPRPRVLLVDDDPLLLRMYQRVCEARLSELRLVTTSRSRDAVLLALLHRPRLILLDLHLPDVGGETLCAWLRGYPALREVFVVGFSGEAEHPGLRRMLDEGATAVVDKPRRVDEIVKLLRSDLGGDEG